MVRDVGMYRHLVGGEVMVDEEAALLVDDELLRKSTANAHCHRSDHLTACGDRIEDAACSTDGEHPPDSSLAGRHIYAHFDEMRAEGGLLMGLGELAELDAVLGHEPFIAGGFRKGHAAVAGPNFATGEDEVIGIVETELCATASRSLTQAA